MLTRQRWVARQPVFAARGVPCNACCLGTLVSRLLQSGCVLSRVAEDCESLLSVLQSACVCVLVFRPWLHSSLPFHISNSYQLVLTQNVREGRPSHALKTQPGGPWLNACANMLLDTLHLNKFQTLEWKCPCCLATLTISGLVGQPSRRRAGLFFIITGKAVTGWLPAAPA